MLDRKLKAEPNSKVSGFLSIGGTGLAFVALIVTMLAIATVTMVMM